MTSEKAEQEMNESCKDVAHILKNLSHPSRLMILCLLAEGPANVNVLTEKCGISQSAVSQFLARMRLQGIVEPERHGQHVYYKVSDPRILELLLSLHRIFKPEEIKEKTYKI